MIIIIIYNSSPYWHRQVSLAAILGIMIIDIAVPVLILAGLLAYQIRLTLYVRRYPLKTHQGRTNHLRENWVKGMMKHESNVCAIQTLRNWTMAATFLASTAIIIAFGVLNLLVTAEQLPNHSAFASSAVPWVFKLIALACNFVLAFFNFSLAIRYYNYAGFLINVPGTDELPRSVEVAGRAVNQGARHYTLGMRHYYLSVPLVCWQFSTQLLLWSSLLLMCMLVYMDYNTD